MPAGRPTVMTDEVLRKLEEAFLLGCTDLEACLVADISKTALYEYQEKHPEFAERKEALKSNPVYKARKVIINALDEGDVLTANKVIERKEGTKAKHELTGAGGKDLKWLIEVVE